MSRRTLLTGIHPASGAAAVSRSRWLDADNLIQFMLHGATGGMDCYGVDPLAIDLSVLSPQIFGSAVSVTVKRMRTSRFVLLLLLVMDQTE